ncbi:Filamentous hemagglutinin [Labeo rohita]|uniref:Filamentous hemagglutinin n=1 Tax=Labeo rohita TaxID=84645 RepID=A0ABQ8KZH7_LABRO|nr:Filamentous hemagglutinin [Labeo rohita]
MSAKPQPPHIMSAQPKPAKPEAAHATLVKPESANITSANSKSAHVTSANRADAELGPRLKGLIASVMDPPLMWVRAAGIPVTSAPSSPTILEVLPPSAALPLMAVTILCVWAAHCTPEASSFHDFAPVPPEVAAPAAEPPEEAASIAEPPEVAAFAAEPPKMVPIYELTASPVTAMEAINVPGLSMFLLCLRCHGSLLHHGYRHFWI